jgi:hypothetical protein
VTLELVKIRTDTATHRRATVNLPRYHVVLYGTAIGHVSRAMLTRERRGKGMRYVYARWTSPGWQYGEIGHRSWECQSRHDGVKRVLEQYGGIGYFEAEELAATVRGVR